MTKPKDIPLGKLDLSKLEMVIRLEIHRRGNWWMVTSEDDSVPGLILSGTTLAKALQDAPELIRQLLRANCGFDIEGKP